MMTMLLIGDEGPRYIPLLNDSVIVKGMTLKFENTRYLVHKHPELDINEGQRLIFAQKIS
jgi:hypothetical protein